jgi:hypothetical protein
VIALRVQRPAAALMLWTSCRWYSNFAFLSFFFVQLPLLYNSLIGHPRTVPCLFHMAYRFKLNSHNYAASLT